MLVHLFTLYLWFCAEKLISILSTSLLLQMMAKTKAQNTSTNDDRKPISDTKQSDLQYFEPT